MNPIVVEFTESMKAFVDGEIASGRCTSPSDFVRNLVREEQKRRACEYLESLALEALETESRPWTKDTMNELRAELRRKCEQAE